MDSANIAENAENVTTKKPVKMNYLKLQTALKDTQEIANILMLIKGANLEAFVCLLAELKMV